MIAIRNAAPRMPRSHVACTACALRDFCEATGQGTVRRRRLEAGEVLFQVGDLQSALYAVRAGFVKTCAVRGEARHLLGYHILGDLLGLDALATGVHRSEAAALNDAEVCELPMRAADALMSEQPRLASRLRGTLSEHLASAGEHIVALAALTARQRVAGFLLELSGRWAGRGYSADAFDVRLTRKEIGSYLGLTFETVSRTLSGLQSEGCIAVAGRGVRIRDRALLTARFETAEPGT